MLRWIFGESRSKAVSRKALQYEEARKTASSDNVRERARLAMREGLSAEFLYYFATDPDQGVRSN